MAFAIVLAPFLIFVIIGCSFRVVEVAKDSSLVTGGKFVLIGARLAMIIWAVIMGTVAFIR